MAMFVDYTTEFNELMASATLKIENGDDASLDLSAAKVALKSLQMEMRKLPASEKRMAKEDCNVCKKQLQSLERKALMGTGKKKATTDSGETKDIKASMSAATEKSKRSKERLEQANRTIMETQQTAIDTMEELGRNRETIERNIEKAKHTNAQMTTAESITYKINIRRMQGILLKSSRNTLLYLVVSKFSISIFLIPKYNGNDYSCQKTFRQ